MHYYYFGAILTPEQCQAYYQGHIKYVLVTADDGQKIQLAFRHLLPFISMNGIRGRFRLTVHKNGSFQNLEKIN